MGENTQFRCPNCGRNALQLLRVYFSAWQVPGREPVLRLMCRACIDDMIELRECVNEVVELRGEG